MSFANYTAEDHTLRRLNSVLHTLNLVATDLDDHNDVSDLEFRWELLVLAENLIDVAAYVTLKSRDIAWLHTPPPEDTTDDLDHDS